jgi:hypothetical protein
MNYATLENFLITQKAKFSGWYPPGKPYQFTWGGEESGVHKGKEYYKPAALLMQNGKKILITVAYGVIQFNEGGEHIYAQGALITEPAALDELDQCFAVLLRYVEESEKPKAIVSPAIAQKDLRIFLESVGGLVIPVLRNDVDDLFKKARAAVGDPQGYYASHEKEFNERGIDDVRADLYQFVLLDRLIELGVLVEMDWKLDADELRLSIGRLSEEKNIGKGISQKEDMESALGIIAQELKEKGKILL